MGKVHTDFTHYFFYICSNDLQGNQMKASAVSTITKSLPIALPVLVNSSLLATFGYINLFKKKKRLVLLKLVF